MLVLFQPVLTALVGAALSVFGVYHTLLQLPSPVVWHHVLSVSPQLLMVLVFLGCIVIALTGLVMLWNGVHGARIRLHQIRRVRWPASSTATSHSPYADLNTPYDDRW